MDFFSLVTLLGGLAFFLYGMHVMSSGLERMAGGKLESALRKMTANKLLGLVLGAGITIAIQSSSAMTVMLVGLVNSGIMQIEQTVSLIMGSNIGTTLTAWLLSLVGMETNNFWLRLLKPENFSLLFALAGIFMIMMSKQSRKRDMGSIFVGFAVLMYGMKLMSGAVAPLADMPEFSSMLTAFRNPLLGVLAGAVFTGVIQSSAASVGILQALALTGSITYGMAIPIIMGQNIGTCVTALISSIGVSRNAKKVGIIHISFNLIGTAVLLVAYYGLDAFFHFAFTADAITAAGVALVHSIFNLATTVMLLPLSNLLVRIANALLPDHPAAHDESAVLLDSRLLATPSVAVGECDSRTDKMCAIATGTLLDAIGTLSVYTREEAEKIAKNEDILDHYEDKLGTFLVQLSAEQLSDSDSLRVSKMLHCIGEFERLGDHAVNILESAEELHRKKLVFSAATQAELDTLAAAITEILGLASSAYTRNDPALAGRIEPLEQTIDYLVTAIRSNQVQRLQRGESSIELGFILADLLGNYERVSDHCSNIGVAIIELSHHSLDTHEYLSAIKRGSDGFDAMYHDYLGKYRI